MPRKLLFIMFSIVFFCYAQWSQTDSLRVSHTNHVAIKLNDGKVLVIGGNGSRTCQLYDPVAGTWSDAGFLNIGRKAFDAVLLQDGRVLAIGGGYPYSAGQQTCELYNPMTNTWTLTDALNTSRNNHKAAVLNDGRVLCVGGLDLITVIQQSEIYDPTTETWSNTNSPSQGLWAHDVIKLGDGRVLTVGGYYNFSGSFANCHIFDPTTETWSTTGSLNYPRAWPGTARLFLGRVLVVGGTGSSGLIPQSEEYDTTTATWTTTGNITPARQSHTATRLDDRRVLVVGGTTGGSNILSDCELYEPYDGTWSDTWTVSPPRKNHSATLLNNGNVLVVGGAITAGDTLYQENFEGGVMPSGWTVVNGNGDSYEWQVGTTGDLGSYEPPDYGTAYAYYSDDDAGSGAPAGDEELISPAIDVEEDMGSWSTGDVELHYSFGLRRISAVESLIVRGRRFINGSWNSWIDLAIYTGVDTNGVEVITLDVLFGSDSLLPADSLQFTWVWHEPSQAWGFAAGVDNILLLSDPGHRDCRVLLPPPIGVTEQETEMMSSEFVVAPNPFTKTAQIYYNLHKPDNVQISIFDVSGACVKKISRFYPGAGNYSFEWNGEDHTGYQVPAGAYFVLLETSDTKRMTKVLCTR